LHRSDEVSSGLEFRDGEQEVVKLLEECAELRRTLKSISGQLGRIENRVKHAFPAATKKVQERKTARANFSASTLSAAEALAEFDKLVALVATGASQDAEQIVDSRSSADLFAIARELGVTFPKSRPSLNDLRTAIFGKVRESVLLSRHSTRASVPS
jgi:cell division septum initiation protein DivIVA